MSGTITDESWQAMEDLFGSERGVVEYGAFILWLNWIMRMMQMMNTGSPSDEEIDQMIKDFETGKRKVPDYRVGTSTPESRFAR